MADKKLRQNIRIELVMERYKDRMRSCGEQCKECLGKIRNNKQSNIELFVFIVKEYNLMI